MSICSDCIHALPVARCVTNLIVGTISSLNTAVYVYIRDVTMDRDIRYAVTSSAAGLITVPITPQRFSEDHSYEIYITKTTAANISVKENITIQAEVSNCVSLRFETIWDNNNAIVTYANQTLTIWPWLTSYSLLWQSLFSASVSEQFCLMGRYCIRSATHSRTRSDCQSGQYYSSRLYSV